MTSTPLALILASVSTPEQAADEKQSLDSQERDLRAIAADHGWRIIDVLRVPGFSRDYISWDECAADMLAQGISAFADLKRYCDGNAFDVLLVRDADRFGRTQSLVMQIAETIGMKMRKNIYSQMNGLVTPEHCRMWAMMAGYTAAAEMDKKLLYHRQGMEKRAANGFHETATPWYHRTVRDPDTGKPLRVELREEYRPIFDAIYRALVEERISYEKADQYLYEQCGIVNPATGKPFRRMAIYGFLCREPAVWGHRVRGETAYRRKRKAAVPYGEWVYDPSAPPPDGIRLYYGVFPPVYAGDQAEALKDEIRRRVEMRGARRPDKLSTFSGLVICDYCGHHMFYQKKKSGWRAYRCVTSEHPERHGHSCASTFKSIHYDKVAVWLDAFLAQLLGGRSLDDAFPAVAVSVENEIAALNRQIDAVGQESKRLVARLGLIPDDLLPEVQEQMQLIARRGAALNEQLGRLKQQQRAQNRGSQQLALREIDDLGLEAFWAAKESRQQQLLKRLFGQWRIVVADGEVIGVAKAGRRPGGHSPA